jgi:hypothetical protein
VTLVFVPTLLSLVPGRVQGPEAGPLDPTVR